MKNKVVTIFGAAGFLGRYIIKHLAEEGAIIRACNRDLTHANTLRPLGAVGQITPMSIDLGHQASVTAACTGADYVINCVGLINIRNTDKFDEIHHLAPKKLAEICWTLGVEKLVHISAMGASPHAKSQYGRTKYAGEQAVLKQFPSATIIKPSLVFGPEDQFLNRFARMAMYSPFIPVIGGGKTRLQPVFVDDVALAVIQALSRDDVKGKTYDVGGPTIYTFKEIIDYILNTIDKKRMTLSLPFWLAIVQAAFIKYLPGIPLTPDQVRMLKNDAVADPKKPGLKELGINPTPMELIAPMYLDRYQRIKRVIPYQ